MPAVLRRRPLQGLHLILDLHGCDRDVLDDVDRLRAIVREAVDAAGCRLLEICAHRFEPRGATVLALLAESHISVHTWPDERSAAADIFTCGDLGGVREAADHLARGLGATTTRVVEVPRGEPVVARTPTEAAG